MKEKSKFLSSLLISLLAGFIYFQLSGDIKDKLTSSVKAVLISQNTEIYGPLNLETNNTDLKKSTGLYKKNKLRIYIKSDLRKKSIQDIKSEKSNISDLKSETQAIIRRPSANKNVDFTAELDKLISKKHKQLSELDDELRKKSAENEISDIDAYNKVKMFINKCDKNQKTNGYGFEYNYVKKETIKKYKTNNRKYGYRNAILNSKNCSNSGEKKSNGLSAPESKRKVNNGGKNKIKCEKESNEIILPDNVLDDYTF
ncbi:MAG: hypothetical protein HGGPFJEG_02510 [Ignavibacteria bacterium]|nr:hypothetical protein [Ignavibacteria bacterium]